MQLTNLQTDYLGRNFEFYAQIDSTQNEIWRRIEKKTIVNGTLIGAEVQTSGRGTHGRKWHTDESGNIAFSFYEELNCPIKKVDGLTRQIADVMAEILKEQYAISIDIKEPNDLMYQQKKIGGILTESRVHLNMVKFLVIGIGINTSQMQFAQEIQDIASSLQKECGVKIHREELIAAFCNRWEQVIKRRIEK